jgi:hypothetical protein
MAKRKAITQNPRAWWWRVRAGAETFMSSIVPRRHYLVQRINLLIAIVDDDRVEQCSPAS